MDHCISCNIIHEETYCPLCTANDEIKELEEQKLNFESEMEDLSKANTDLTNRVSELIKEYETNGGPTG